MLLRVGDRRRVFHRLGEDFSSRVHARPLPASPPGYSGKSGFVAGKFGGRVLMSEAHDRRAVACGKPHVLRRTAAAPPAAAEHPGPLAPAFT